MKNKFVSSKLFDVLIYTIGGTILLCSEIKKLAISPFRNYNK